MQGQRGNSADLGAGFGWECSGSKKFGFCQQRSGLEVAPKDLHARKLPRLALDMPCQKALLSKSMATLGAASFSGCPTNTLEAFALHQAHLQSPGPPAAQAHNTTQGDHVPVENLDDDECPTPSIPWRVYSLAMSSYLEGHAS